MSLFKFNEIRVENIKYKSNHGPKGAENKFFYYYYGLIKFYVN